MESKILLLETQAMLMRRPNTGSKTFSMIDRSTFHEITLTASVELTINLLSNLSSSFSL